LSCQGIDCPTIIDKLCSMFNGTSSICHTIYEEYLKENILNKLNNKVELLNEKNYLSTIREINRLYDEIVLTNCIIDERIYLNSQNKLNDLLNPLNENRNEKNVQNLTPLTANQHLTFQSNDFIQGLTPISQANQLIEHLYFIIGQQQQLKPNENIKNIIGEQSFIGNMNLSLFLLHFFLF
jgi:hypothetical protein